MKDTAVHKWQTQGLLSKHFISAKMFHLSVPYFWKYVLKIDLMSLLTFHNKF